MKIALAIFAVIGMFSVGFTAAVMIGSIGWSLVRRVRARRQPKGLVLSFERNRLGA